MNSVYNSSSDICCTNKEQCFTPTLLSWSSIQLSSKSFTSSMTETGKFMEINILKMRVLFTKYRLRLLHFTHQTKPNQNRNQPIYYKPNSADCDRFEIYVVFVYFISSSSSTFFVSCVK